MKIPIDEITTGVLQAEIMFNWAGCHNVIVVQTLKTLVEKGAYFDKEHGRLVSGPKMGVIRNFLAKVVTLLNYRSLNLTSDQAWPLIEKLDLKSAMDDVRNTLGLKGSLCETEGEDRIDWYDVCKHLEGLDCTVREGTATEDNGYASATVLGQPGFWSGGNPTGCELTQRVQVLEAELELQRILIRKLTNRVLEEHDQDSYSELMRTFLGPDEDPSTSVGPQGAPVCDDRPGKY